MSERFVANRGGTAPANLRACFDVWAKEYSRRANWRTLLMPAPDTRIPRDFKWLRGQLWNCTDMVPHEVVQAADNLKLPYGVTYSSAVRSIDLRQKGGTSGYVAGKPVEVRGLSHGEWIDSEMPSE